MKNIFVEKRGWGKNILFWANIHPWGATFKKPPKCLMYVVGRPVALVVIKEN